jgi:signal peptidase I
MEPNFYSQEYLIIDELTYRFHEPKRGEVIVFKYSNTPKEFFLKRIIGLPGERVKVSDGKVVIYNTDHPEGVQIQESYLPTDLETIGEKNTVLGDRQYFVMGDNRPNSYDSRRFGPIDQSAIVGRVIFRGWPFGRIQKFNTPDFKIGVEEENKK